MVLVSTSSAGGIVVGGRFVAVAGSAVGVSGMVVEVTVGDEFVSAAGSAVGAGDIVVGVGDGMGVGVDAQAATKAVTRMSTII